MGILFGCGEKHGRENENRGNFCGLIVVLGCWEMLRLEIQVSEWNLIFYLLQLVIVFGYNMKLKIAFKKMYIYIYVGALEIIEVLIDN